MTQSRLKRFLALTCGAALHISCSPIAVDAQDNQLETQSKDKTKTIFLNDKRIHDRVRGFLEDATTQIEVSVAVLDDGQVEHLIFRKNNEIISPNFNCNRQYQIGSISKVVTVDKLLDVLDDSKLNLDTRLADALEMNVDPRAKDVTLRQLATHSSGLPVMPQSFFESGYDEFDPYKDFGKIDLKRTIESELVVDAEKIGTFQYSNLGVSILGLVIEGQTGMTFDTFARNTIGNAANYDKLATGFDENSRSPILWDLNAISPAGGIIGSSCDLVSYAQSAYKDKTHNYWRQIEPAYARNSQIEQGLGWMLLNTKSGKLYPFHAGTTGGYSGMLVTDPAKERAVAVLVNQAYSDSRTENLGFGIMKEIGSRAKILKTKPEQ